MRRVTMEKRDPSRVRPGHRRTPFSRTLQPHPPNQHTSPSSFRLLPQVNSLNDPSYPQAVIRTWAAPGGGGTQLPPPKHPTKAQTQTPTPTPIRPPRLDTRSRNGGLDPVYRPTPENPHSMRRSRSRNRFTLRSNARSASRCCICQPRRRASM